MEEPASWHNREQDLLPVWEHLRENRVIKCQVPQKEFSTDYLSRHFHVDAVEKDYVCKICSKKLSRKDNLLRHMLAHRAQKSHFCEICSKGFTRKEHLSRHMILHTGRKAYKCETCFKSFSRKETLAQHMLVHSGAEPYECDICFAKFTRKESLSRHMLIHQPCTPHECGTCFKTFSRKENLARHMLLHRPRVLYPCETCFKGFSRKESLSRHMELHGPRVPYVCKVCLRRFTRKENLTRHMLLHTNEKFHRCETCFKLFSRKDHLSKHMLVHCRRELNLSGVAANKFVKEENSTSTFIKQENMSRYVVVPNKVRVHDVCGAKFLENEQLESYRLACTSEVSCARNSIKEEQCQWDLGDPVNEYVKKESLQSSGFPHTAKESLSKEVCAGDLRHVSWNAVIVTSDEPHECKICSTKFSDMIDLSNHVLSTHVKNHTSVNEWSFGNFLNHWFV